MILVALKDTIPIGSYGRYDTKTRFLFDLVLVSTGIFGILDVTGGEL